jgi:hypothetical protein
MNYKDYIKTELLVLVPVLYLVGVGLKKSKLPDKWIPATLGAVSVTLSAVWVIATSDLSGISQIASAFFTAVTQGVLAAGASVYANQLYVQASKEN